MNRILSWLKRNYRKVVSSIAFYPMFIVVLFAVGGWFLVTLDRSEWGIELKSSNPWLGLKDAAAARSIVSTIAAGILSLAVFSFSMVMVVLNQAASQLSNRILDQLIGDRFQQLVLGIYIGTIVHAMMLLTTIRENDQGTSIPALSIYVLIGFTILDIFLFIYFLHFVTRAVQYEVIIHHIQRDTRSALEKRCALELPDPIPNTNPLPFSVNSENSGLYEGVDQKRLLRFCERHDVMVQITELPGSFILSGSPLLYTDRPLVGDELDDLRSQFQLARSSSVAGHFSFGFRQLTEIAMKALSPGVNDPGTALLALRSLFRLFVLRSALHPQQNFSDEKGNLRIIVREWSFELLFTSTIHAIWDYGKEDRSVRYELEHLLVQLRSDEPEVKHMLHRVCAKQAERERLDLAAL